MTNIAVAALPSIATTAVHAATSPACPKKTQMSDYGGPMPNPVLDEHDKLRDEVRKENNASCTWCNKPIFRTGGHWFHPETKSFTCLGRLNKLNRDAKPKK